MTMVRELMRELSTTMICNKETYILPKAGTKRSSAFHVSLVHCVMEFQFKNVCDVSEFCNNISK